MPALAHTDKDLSCAHPVTTPSYSHITLTVSELCFPRGASRTPFKAGYPQHSKQSWGTVPRRSQLSAGTQSIPSLPYCRVGRLSGAQPAWSRSKPCSRVPGYSLRATWATLCRKSRQSTQDFCFTAESQNHRMIWIRKDRIDHLVPTSLPWAGTPSTRPVCSKPHPAWP